MITKQFESLTKFINGIQSDAAGCLGDIHRFNGHSACAIFEEILRYATATHAPAILAGREYFSRLAPEWVRHHLCGAIPQMIDMDNDWDYRRFLELLSPKYPDLVEHFAKIGVLSKNPGVVETARDYLET